MTAREPETSDPSRLDSPIPPSELANLLLESTGDGIYGVDLRGNCIFVNPAAVRILGYRAQADLMGRHMHDLVHHTRPDGQPYPVEECRIYEALKNLEGTHVDDEIMFRADGTSPVDVAFTSNTIILNGFTLTRVPEPTSLVLAGIGLVCLVGCTWRKRRRR